MLGVAAHGGLQDLAQALGGTSSAHYRGIHYHAVEVAQQTGYAQYGPPDHELVDLSNEPELQARQRPTGEDLHAGRSPAVEPVRLEADRGHGGELLAHELESQRDEAYDPAGAG